MWANERAVLVAMVDYGRCSALATPAPATARMRLGRLGGSGFPTTDGRLADPIVDVGVEGVTLDGAFSAGQGVASTSS